MLSIQTHWKFVSPIYWNGADVIYIMYTVCCNCKQYFHFLKWRCSICPGKWNISVIFSLVLAEITFRPWFLSICGWMGFILWRCSHWRRFPVAYLPLKRKLLVEVNTDLIYFRRHLSVEQIISRTFPEKSNSPKSLGKKQRCKKLLEEKAAIIKSTTRRGKRFSLSYTDLSFTTLSC